MTTYTVHNLIHGDTSDGAGEEQVTVLNPSLGEPIASFREATPAQVDDAVRSAREAATSWRRQTPGQRAEVMHAVAQLAADHFDELAELESVDAGKPISAVRDVELPGIVGGLRFFAGAGRSSAALPAGEYVADNTVMVRREPVGVVAAITPWNFPLQQAVWKIGPA
ncbi:MAG TPA: aldehyde dehydrogenase family protein, partial [Nocardioides sp.]|nr:aldehyde dehydrogenase family protein [Nocardioides sp.]